MGVGTVLADDPMLTVRDPDLDLRSLDGATLRLTRRRETGLQLEDVSGLAYEPWRNAARIIGRTDVNYLACASKPG